MSDPVLDSSAVLALLLNESGSAAVAAVLPGAWLSSVNLAEVVSKLGDRGMPAKDAREAVEALGAQIADFDIEQACLAGELRTATRAAGLSLGDRACLALARIQGVAALTADTAWATLSGFDVTLIR